MPVCDFDKTYGRLVYRKQASCAYTLKSNLHSPQPWKKCEVTGRNVIIMETVGFVQNSPLHIGCLKKWLA
uniref:Uncharacterized protein n=1 Tax=Anguilla anguilla TaxID=7936 RepID=A0A0E9WPA4_ANGAN